VNKTIFRRFRYRLYPTPAQADELARFCGVVRLVYNLAWEQRRDHWRAHLRQTGKRISWASQSREVTALRREYDWIDAVPRECLEQALRDLDAAYTAFFSGRAKYPNPRRKGERDAIRLQGRFAFTRSRGGRWAEVRIMCLGWVRFRSTRPILGTVKNVTVSRDAIGWHVSFACEIEHEAKPTTLPAVGIDRGVANTLALSTGEMLNLPDLAGLDRQHRRAQRVLARRKKGSKRRQRQLRRCARIKARAGRIRRDWHHKASTAIAQRFSHVALEDLNVKGMTANGPGKRGLNRSILNQGWHAFETMLAYKLEERGGTLHKVPAAYTSLACSQCGTVDRRSRESQAVFACKHCGHIMHADINAAINISRRSASALRVEACHWAANETRTASGRPMMRKLKDRRA
jgi:putative transposase